MYLDVHTHAQSHINNSVAFYSLGIHPEEIEDNLSEKKQILERYSILDCVIAIGEAGLDKTYNTNFDLQKDVFSYQIHLSEKIKKPLIIHCVKAFDELIALKKEIKPQQNWIIHGFRGKPEQMQQFVQHDIYFSFGMYFNEETIKQIPINRLFLETDNSEISIQEVYHKVAKYLPLSEDELILQIEKNFAKTFFNRTFAAS